MLRPQRAFVALGRGNAVAEVDPRTFAIRRYFPVGSRNWGIGMSPDGKRLFAANGLSGDVDRDRPGREQAASRRSRSGGKPWGVVVTP